MAAGVAGLILAGGAGTRFGGPKAFAVLPDGRRFLVACADAFAAAGLSPVLATVPAETVPAGGQAFGAEPLPAAGLPMFESLGFGLGRLLGDTRWDRVVVVPVDHPLVRPETLARSRPPPPPPRFPPSAGSTGTR